jgi:hypothetical protein
MDATTVEKAREQIAAYLQQIRPQPLYPIEVEMGLPNLMGNRLVLVPQSLFPIEVKSCEAARQLLAASGDIQVWAVVESVRRTVGDLLSDVNWFLRPLRTALLRKKLPFTEEAILAIVDALLQGPRLYPIEVGIAGLVGAVERFVAAHGLSEALRQRLERLGPYLAANSYAEYHKAAERVGRLLEMDDGSPTLIVWRTDEAWVEHLRRVLEGSDAASREHWQPLLLHCQSATVSKPSQKWLKQATALLAPIGNDPFVRIVTGVLQQLGKSARTAPQRVSGLGGPTDLTLIHDVHSDLLRGLIWCTSLATDETLTAAVGAAADACFHKIPWIGARSPKIGNACLFALSQQTATQAVAELSRLKTRVKTASARKQLGKSLDAAAERAGMSAEELEEVAVPTLGLTGVGALVRQLGDVTVHLRIGAEGKAELTWEPAGKKAQASVPSSLKEAFADDIKALKKTAKEIDKLLPAQRLRLERLFLQQAGWTLDDFRSRYLDHPLVGTLARRLIWRFEDAGRVVDGIWSQGRLVDPEDKPLDGLGQQTRVRLWHPSDASAPEVLAWRNWLEVHAVRQPFKQAHREIYLLTDAERATAVYSNRFAAHILRQHQFAALCQQRGWRYRLQGHFDSANTPTLELPRWDLRVEFWVEAVETQTSELQIYLYLSADQVRFCRIGNPLPLRLEEVPPLVFSEVMRDVDLFVGVCSVGNDPHWRDGGPGGHFRQYWEDYAFGDLSATAQTRREVLERLGPRLKIADRCSFLDRFLVVRGDLRTYKIHLGSGNILMSPNDQYLCIVPQRGAAAAGNNRIFLPFEGDNMLSIILSKAFLLAEDSKITDASIVRQIQK